MKPGFAQALTEATDLCPTAISSLSLAVHLRDCTLAMPTNRAASTINEGNDVIVISSDDESGPPPRRPARAKAAAAARPPGAGTLKRQRTKTDLPPAAPVVDHTSELVALRKRLEEKDAVSRPTHHSTLAVDRV
jgi:hypothetical protein